uniref:(northern house mosquito) hypothetical protein n=1 Tax=Culex pipiens TaxID=7175 RepID=A0A8D8GT86_CULPI
MKRFSKFCNSDSQNVVARVGFFRFSKKNQEYWLKLCDYGRELELKSQRICSNTAGDCMESSSSTAPRRWICWRESIRPRCPQVPCKNSISPRNNNLVRLENFCPTVSGDVVNVC